MNHDFDQVIDRRGTDCIKWQFYVKDEETYEWNPGEGCLEEDGVLPLWVADMDFQSPPPVIDALVNRARQGIFGYTGMTKAYAQTVADWMQRRHGWEIQTDWITVTPGVVNALHIAVRAYTQPGDHVLIHSPVYHPFTHSIERQDRVASRSPLLLENGRYRMDFEDLARRASDPAVKLAILCHPHNPVGRVWAEDELRRFGEICLSNGVVVISDEVHADLLYSGQTFTPFARLGEDFAQQSIITTSPSKTFNLPGLKTSNIIIPNASLRQTFQEQLLRSGIYGMNAFGAVATKVAYQHGEPWLADVMAYIEGNYRSFAGFIQKRLPELRIIEPEGTYLVWVDCRALGLSDEELHDKFFTDAKVYVNDGTTFGPEGSGFVRFNIACPREMLMEALERMERVLKIEN